MVNVNLFLFICFVGLFVGWLIGNDDANKKENKYFKSILTKFLLLLI